MDPVRAALDLRSTDADITGVMQEGMLARFAAALQRGQIQAITGQGFGGQGATIVVNDENCLVRCSPFS